MLGALPPAQPPATSPGLLTLIALLDARRGVFIQSDDAALDAAAASALQDAPTASAGALADLLRSHGWDGSTFARPLDIPILASRLKAFLFDSLRHRGGGSYSTVFGCRSQLTGGPVVLKRLRLDPPAAKPGEGLPCTAVREVSLMRTLAASPHVVE